jgi:Family of unknown function (DUF6600)
MKFGKILTVPLLALLFALAPSPGGAAVSVSVRISSFHRDLAPYGRWVAVASYGEVWCPRGVAAGWQPYLDGEWVDTDYGWTWVSYDPFGEVPFHYGTWVWVDPYGWVWIPGTVWAPAWVTWCYSDDYVGWAPLPPSIDLRLSGYVGPPIVLPASRYVFVPTGRFVGQRISRVRLSPRRNSAILAHTRKTTTFGIYHGVVRDPGPPVTRIERVTHRRIERRSAGSLKLRPTSVRAAGALQGRRVRVIARQPVSRAAERARRGPTHTSARASSRAARSAARRSTVGHRPPATARTRATKARGVAHRPAPYIAHHSRAPMAGRAATPRQNRRSAPARRVAAAPRGPTRVPRVHSAATPRGLRTEHRPAAGARSAQSANRRPSPAKPPAGGRPRSNRRNPHDRTEGRPH